MNIKKAVKYQILEAKKSIIIYYGIIYAIYILLTISVNGHIRSGNEASVGGMEFSTIIFIFIVGMNSFKDTFRMFLQNGLSRKTLFESYVLSIIPISILMALIDSMSGVLWDTISNYNSLYLQIYRQRYYASVNPVIRFVEGFLWYAFVYMTFAIVGYFITTLYYRMNKKLKIIVSVGFPAFWIIIFPFIEKNLTNGAMSEAIANFILFVLGFQNGYSPYYFMVTCIITFIIFGALSYSLVRKAVVKK